MLRRWVRRDWMILDFDRYPGWLKIVTFVAERKNLTFESDVRIGDLVVLGDPGRVRQILTNLLTNSIKFTSEGSVKLSVFKKRETTDTIEIEFVVKDSVSIAQLYFFTPHLFEPSISLQIRCIRLLTDLVQSGHRYRRGGSKTTVQTIYPRRCINGAAVRWNWVWISSNSLCNAVPSVKFWVALNLKDDFPCLTIRYSVWITGTHPSRYKYMYWYVSSLGLTICKNLVDLMHGTIKLESSIGNGTTASFRIPFNKPPLHSGGSPLVDIGSLPDRLQSEMSLSCTSSDQGYNTGSPSREGTPQPFSIDGGRKILKPPMPEDPQLPMSERNKIEVLVVEDVCYIPSFLSSLFWTPRTYWKDNMAFANSMILRCALDVPPAWWSFWILMIIGFVLKNQAVT